MKLKIKLPEFGIHMSNCINKNNYTFNSKISSYSIYCQKLAGHPLKLNRIENKVTIIPIQTDNKEPGSVFISGTPTGIPGVHKIGENKDTIQILGPTLVYNIKTDEDVKVIETFITAPEFTSTNSILADTQNKLNTFNFDYHLQNKQRNEIHIFEFNKFVEKHAINIKVSGHEEMRNLISTLKTGKNVVHKHTELLYNKRYEDHAQIKTAKLLSETTQDFFSNPGDNYKTKDLKKMGEEQEKILEITLKTHTCKNEIEYQKYYELKKSATKIKNLVDKDSDFD